MSKLIPVDDDLDALTDVVSAVLETLRGQSTRPATLDGLLLYYLDWHRQRKTRPDTPSLSHLVSNTIIDTALEDLRVSNRDASILLSHYYVDRFSDEKIRIKYPEHDYFSSRPVINRHRAEALQQLIALIAQRERTARSEYALNLLNALPARLPHKLYGREADAHRLKTLLQDPDKPVIYLSGMGGIGKSALAADVVADQIRALHFRHLYWFAVPEHVRQVSHTLPDGFWRLLIGRLVQAFGSAALERAEPAQQEAELRRVLAAVPHLIVIDDLDAEPLLNGLAERLADLAGVSKFLLIGRVEPAPETVSALHVLQQLPASEMATLITERAMALHIVALSDLAPDLLQQTYRLIGGHPQALTLLLQLARRRSLADVLAAFVTVDMPDIETLYNEIYAVLWSLVNDQAPALDLLRALTLVAPAGAEDDYLAAVSGLPDRAFWSAIEELGALSFLVVDDRLAAWRYTIHQLTRTYLHHRSHDEALLAQLDPHLAAGCAYWKQSVTKLPDDPRQLRLTVENLPQHYDNIALLLYRAFARPDLWAAAVDCCGDLFLTVENSPYWREWLALCEVGLQNAPASGGTRERLRLMRMLGWLYRIDNRHAEAIDILNAAIELAKPDNNIDLMGQCYVYLSIAQRNLHQFEQAFESADNALDIFEELRGTHQAWLGSAHLNKGLAFFHSGSFEQALPHYAASARYYAEAGHLPGVVRAHNNRGNALKELECYDDALAQLTLAEDLARQTQGLNDRDLIATSLLDLALYPIAVPQLAEVKRYAHARIAAADIIPYHRALLMLALGQLARRDGDLHAAGDLLGQACAAWRDQPERPLRAVALAELGLCHIAQALPTAARACLTEAESVVADAGAANPLYKTALAQMAVLHAALTIDP